MPSGKVEEFDGVDRSCWQATYDVGHCTDCGCVDVGVGVMHHPDCGTEHTGDFDTKEEAVQALSEAGVTEIRTVTMAQKKLWSDGSDAPF
jgi:hypothetical protein